MPAERVAGTEYPGEDVVWLKRDVAIRLEESGATEVRDRAVVQILTERGRWAAVWRVPYDRETETVEVTAARTYVAVAGGGEPSVLEVRAEDVTEGAPYAGLPGYEAYTVRTLHLPGAAAGALLEVEVVRKHRAPRVRGELGARLALQRTAPVKEAHWTVRIPEGKRLRVRFAHIPSPTVGERVADGERVYEWQVSGLPALRLDEAMMPPAEDLLGTAHVTTLGSWGPVCAWWRMATDGRDAATPGVMALARERTAGARTERERVAGLYRMVAGLDAVDVELGTLSDAPHAPEEMLRRGYGDCKDKTAALRALLQGVGIASDYVLVRTRERGALDTTGFGAEEFNHVILVAKVEGKDTYLDPSARHLAAGQLPSAVEGTTALAVRGEGELVALPASRAEENAMEARVTLEMAREGGAMIGQVAITYRGLLAAAQRELLAGMTADEMRGALDAALGPRLAPGGKLTALEVLNADDPERELVLQAKCESGGFLGGYEKLLFGHLPTLVCEANAMRGATKRESRFAQRPGSMVKVEATIRLPHGYRVVGTPGEVHYDGPPGRYDDVVKAEGNAIRYECEVVRRSGTFPASDWEEFRKWGGLLALEGRNGLQYVAQRPEG